MELGISLSTKQHGEEVSWSLGSCNSLDVDYDDYTTYDPTCCLIPGTYTLHCIDSYSDGWHGGYIQINGTRYCEDFTNGQEKTVEMSVLGNFKSFSVNLSNSFDT